MLRTPIFLAVWIAIGGLVAAETSGSAAASPKSQPDAAAAILKDPMVFYLAKGEPDACGQGCSEWIAAEGAIDAEAPQRLRALLGRLAKRKLPIFFHSVGGLVGPAMEIGRLLREREIPAGVSRTIPSGCAAASDETCRTLKRSGQVVAAELNNLSGCNSACVYALIGARIRMVPPGARLGVHSSKILKLDPEGRLKAIADARTQRYLRDMKMVADLFEVISGVPYEQTRFLSRDEIAAFGIDRREFQETRWIAAEASPRWVMKLVLEAKGASRKEFRISMIRLSCAGSGRVGIGYLRGLGSDEIGASRSIKLAIDGRTFVFPQKGSVSKIDAIDRDGSFDTRFMYGSFELLEAAAARETIEIVESDLANSATPHIIKLSTLGLSNGLKALQKSCDPQVQFLGAPAVKFLDGPGARAGDELRRRDRAPDERR
jgi:hypothetical protein